MVRATLRDAKDQSVLCGTEEFVTDAGQAQVGLRRYRSSLSRCRAQRAGYDLLACASPRCRCGGHGLPWTDSGGERAIMALSISFFPSCALVPVNPD